MGNGVSPLDEMDIILHFNPLDRIAIGRLIPYFVIVNPVFKVTNDEFYIIQMEQ